MLYLKSKNGVAMFLNKIIDLESAEKEINSFTNALIFWSVLTIIFLMSLVISLHEFPTPMIAPFVTCDILFILSLGLKTTKSRTLSIIIFILLLDLSISGILTTHGFPKSGTVIAILFMISAFTTIKATFLRYKILGGKTIFKNVFIRNLFAFAYSFAFIFLFFKCTVLYAYFHKSIITTVLMPNLKLLVDIILFFGLILYVLAIAGKLPFTNKFPMVIYSEEKS